MKKVILLIVALISLIGFVNAQNPQWFYYNNGDYIYALAEEGNDMWVGTNGGVVKLDKTTGVPTFYNTSNSGLPSNLVREIAIDGNGTKWIGTGDESSGKGLTEFDGTNWTTYDTSNSGLPDNGVWSIALEANGTKWLGSLYWDGGLAAYNENGIPVSIKENIATEYNLKVFPNPSSDQITFELLHTSAIKNTYLTIYNINSQQLLQQEITEPKTIIDISSLPSGVFFVRLTGERTVNVGKFIKQ